MLDQKWSPRRVDSNVTNPERLLFLGNFTSPNLHLELSAYIQRYFEMAPLSGPHCGGQMSDGQRAGGEVS